MQYSAAATAARHLAEALGMPRVATSHPALIAVAPVTLQQEEQMRVRHWQSALARLLCLLAMEFKPTIHCTGGEEILTGYYYEARRCGYTKSSGP